MGRFLQNRSRNQFAFNLFKRWCFSWLSLDGAKNNVYINTNSCFAICCSILLQSARMTTAQRAICYCSIATKHVFLFTFFVMPSSGQKITYFFEQIKGTWVFENFWNDYRENGSSNLPLLLHIILFWVNLLISSHRFLVQKTSDKF